ncbi:MAG: adenylate/guanylate cyclase domain-containing protein [Methylococcaceae bacterium]|nr:adenylate/guanylate cyclase domain-containing protein [Methylococcaceae bacterium]
MLRVTQFSLATVVLLAIILANISFYIAEPLPIRIIRYYLFDQYQQWHPRLSQDVGVRVIDIDDESLQRIGQWPWPRTRIASLLNCFKNNQKAIGIDFIFSEPDNTSPAAMLKLWQVAPEVSAQLKLLPDHDQQLATAIAKQPTVLGFSAEVAFNTTVLPAEPFRFIYSGDTPDAFVHSFTSAKNSLPLLEKSAIGNGALMFTPDVDGVVRKVPLVIKIQEKVYPAFSLEILRVVLHQKNYLVKTTADTGIGIEHIMTGDFKIPTTANGEMWVYYAPLNPLRTIPAWQILNGDVSAESLKDNILLLGSSGRGLTDIRFTPVSGLIPGVEVHAQLIEQMLTQHFLIRPNWAISLEVLMLFLTSLLVGIVTLNSGIVRSASIALAALSILLSGSWLLFKSQGLLLDGLTPTLMVIVIFMLSSFIRHTRSEQRQRWIHGVFSRYVSPNLVDYLISHPEQLELNGQRLECSFILTDLANSTQLMEKIEPSALASRLNIYLDQMIAIAFRYDGTLTRIVGDGIVIMFSAPVKQADHRQRAVMCALEMHAYAKNYVAELHAQGLEFCDTRIGVNTGMVLVGNFGGSTIFDYRALGDPINTASRLESANRYFGTGVCVAEATLNGCADIVSRPIGRLLLKGKMQPLLAYEPLGVNSQQAPMKPDGDYEHAYNWLNVDSVVALTTFTTLATSRPNDALVAFHLKRLQCGEQSDVVVLSEK